jgi:AcrR family transcriptional regulator
MEADEGSENAMSLTPPVRSDGTDPPQNNSDDLTGSPVARAPSSASGRPSSFVERPTSGRGSKTEFKLTGESRMPASTMGRRALRTSTLIQETARKVFLQRGYHGTKIEDIAEAAGVSRASFYTYFPSKRDVLLALGGEAYKAMDILLNRMKVQADSGAPDLVEQVVRSYMEMLDDHGGFLLVWGGAGLGDPDLRTAGMRAKLHSARRLARMFGLDAPAGEDPGLVGLALQVMVDRYWYYQQVAGLPSTRDKAVTTLSAIIRARINAGDLASHA